MASNNTLPINKESYAHRNSMGHDNLPISATSNHRRHSLMAPINSNVKPILKKTPSLKEVPSNYNVKNEPTLNDPPPMPMLAPQSNIKTSGEAAVPPQPQHSRSRSNIVPNTDLTISGSSIVKPRQKIAETTQSNIFGLSNANVSDGLTHKTGIELSKASSLNSSAEFSVYATHNFLLHFLDPMVEKEYNKWFYERVVRLWRLAYLLAALAALAVGIWIVSLYPAQGQSYLNVLNQRTGPVPNDIGYFCYDCPCNAICSDYNGATDLGFIVGGEILPLMLAYSSSFWLKKHVFSAMMHFISFLSITFTIAFGVIIRYLVIEPTSPPYVSSMLINLMMLVGIIFCRIRFVFTASMVISVTAVFTAVTLSVPNSSTATLLTVILSGLCGIFVAYESETHYRKQFKTSKKMQLQNAKLLDQLRGIRSSYGNKALADLESPLEKAISIVRSILAEPDLSFRNVHSLSYLLRLLHSGNLLQPDFENQVREGQVVMDADQEAWLFTELTNRKKKIGSAAGSSSTVREKEREKQESTPKLGGGRRRSFQPSNTVPDGIVHQHEKLLDSAVTVAPLTTIPSDNNMNPVGTEFETLNAPPLPSVIRHEGSFVKEATNSHMISSGSVDSNTNTSIDISPQQYYNFLLTTCDWKFINSVTINTTASEQDSTISDIPDSDNTGVPSKYKCVMSHVNDWNFPIFEYAEVTNSKPLQFLVTYLFQKHGIFEAVPITYSKFIRFFKEIESGYHSDNPCKQKLKIITPDHNSIHAADVLHACSYFIQTPSIGGHFSCMDLLSIFLAAAIHDYDHPGLNNSFLIATQSEKSVLYNDKSVLENHHLAASFKILLKPDCNFISFLGKTDFKHVRSTVIDMVLATDLLSHFEIVNSFKGKISVRENFLPKENKDDQTLLCKMIIKCGDVSNPAKESKLYNYWVQRIAEEGFRQGEKEKLMGLPISAFMDRETINVISWQRGFLDIVCLPLFESFHSVYGISTIMDYLHQNRDYWMQAQAQVLQQQQGGKATSTLHIKQNSSSKEKFNQTEKGLKDS